MSTSYFDLAEFKCPCCEKIEIDVYFLHKLNFARSMAGIPFHINSGYRCEKHNKEVGGKPDSAHRDGTAADIKCETSRERYLMLHALFAAGFNRIGIGETFLHVDSDETKDTQVIWLY
jgi:zinc D-Ala-D-Ala carboxypeptidase